MSQSLKWIIPMGYEKGKYVPTVLYSNLTNFLSVSLVRESIFLKFQ